MYLIIEIIKNIYKKIGYLQRKNHEKRQIHKYILYLYRRVKGTGMCAINSHNHSLLLHWKLKVYFIIYWT